MHQIEIKTTARTHFLDITQDIQAAVDKSSLRNGVASVFVPHTTAGITINENADPDVVHDMSQVLDALIPWESAHYRHAEGNTAAHVKATLTGSSVQVLVQDGRLQLGTWQSIYLSEFDGPRTRSVWIQTCPA